MNKTSGAELPRLLQWTRTGMVEGTWGPYETFESLVFSENLRGHLQKLALGFLGAQDFCVKAKLPWRRGAFLFGPEGCGKSAAGRAIALLLGWQHVIVPEHEILDAHHLMRALGEARGYSPGVIVIDNIDRIFKRIDPRVFFDAFDFVAERSDGVFWIATSSRSEEVPKDQLLRPGRFEETVRLPLPSSEIKRKYYEAYLEPFMVAALGDQAEMLVSAKNEHLGMLEANPDLTFAHLQEMRLLIAKVIMGGTAQGGAFDQLIPEFQMFCQEQVIAGDRSGGRSAQNVELEERVRLADPRLLLSALHVLDAFKKIVEASVSTASDALVAANHSQQS